MTRVRAHVHIPALVPGVCQVWWAGIDDVRPGHDALLADADLARRDGLRLADDRKRLTAAWALARVLLGAATGCRPERLQFDRTCRGCGAQHGKPWLPAAPDLYLSVAHSGSCIAVAVARGSPVGVDVEAVVEVATEDLDLLAGETLAAEEGAELARLPREARARAFTTYWTRKEAVLKATGEGLTAPLQALVVSPPSQPPRVLRGGCGPPTLHDLHPPPGFVAALAVLGGTPVRVVEADARWLLDAAVVC